MIEKRFTLAYEKGNWWAVRDGDITLWKEEVVGLLNEQHEQINTLRESRRELISANNEYRMRETELAQELSTLVDENEQLKSEIETLHEQLSHFDLDEVMME